ncbi:ABC transporter substrate-binding protein [Salinibacillus xinjiangensis]|uniref:BMP family ABC transporter substrate-binding protein n=1 Tax=Salinibacillus xinjiangensis TaxID=1229268 RepID=A0A6G1X7V5_9BACI|nr:ABC transporter substrate-binding protein [Salinibacillus xinjiangensis]MRG86960.1 BMP family ABC transporter substrate-binding protein [Salinibacillus xinjiangensis]
MKKLGMILLFGLLLFLAACGTDSEDTSSSDEQGNASGGEDAGSKEYVVGVLQHVEHPSLDAATEGFKAALDESDLNVQFEEENAQGDSKNNQSIASKFVGDEVDLIFANATPSAQSAANETEEIPVVFTSVTDPVGAGLVDSMESPGGNVTGTSDSNPDAIPSTMQLIKDMGYETVGTVYNSGEQNSVTQIEQMKKVADELGLTVEEASAATSADVKQAAESLVGEADVFYIITDNTVVSALESVIMVSEQEKLPLFVGELDSVARGGFAAYGFDYYDIGYEAGQKAIQILKGEKEPGEIPAEYPQNLILNVNEDAAANMGVEITDEIKEQATIVQTQQE